MVIHVKYVKWKESLLSLVCEPAQLQKLYTASCICEVLSTTNAKKIELLVLSPLDNPFCPKTFLFSS